MLTNETRPISHAGNDGLSQLPVDFGVLERHEERIRRIAESLRPQIHGKLFRFGGDIHTEDAANTIDQLPTGQPTSQRRAWINGDVLALVHSRQLI